MYHGRLLHAAAAEVQRCEEEVSFLVIESRRLQEWVVYMVQQVQQA